MSNPTDDAQPDDATSSATDDSSVGLSNREEDDAEPSQQDAHNPETDEDTASGGAAD
jgi:hypothetical protein